MSLKTYNIDVPITPGVMPPVIHIGQYDSGREYIAHLKNDDGTDYTIPANSTATFTGCNPRKEVFEIECNITNNAVIFVPQDEATSMWGKYGATLNLTLNDEKMSPIVILMDVQKAGATDEEIAGAANFPDAVTEAVDAFLTEALEEGDLGSLYVTKAAQIPATSGMTQPVGITPEGLLVTAPGGEGGGGTVDQMKYFGYATSSDNANNNRTASLSGFALNKGGIVVIRFTTDVNKSSATLSVGGTTAKGIRYQDAALSGGEIRENDTVAFMYDGTYYRVLSIVRSLLEPLVGGSGSVTPAQVIAAVAAGKPVTIIYIDQTGVYSFASWSIQPINGTATVVGSAITPSGNSVTLSGTSESSAWTFAVNSGGGGGAGALQHAYGFSSQDAYDAFVQDYPDAIQPGDYIYITDRAQNNVSVKIYQRNDLGTLNQIITTIGDSYIVTLTESSGTWSASHDGSPVTFANIVSSGVNEGKRIVAYIPSLGLYIPGDYIFTTGSDQYIQFDAVTFNGIVRMGQSFVINSSGVQADIKALGKVIVHATTQDSGQSYLVDFYASQIIAMRQYNADIVLVDGLTGDEYPLIGDNGATAAYFGGFNRSMTKTVHFTVYNATNVPGKSEAAYTVITTAEIDEIIADI